MNYDLMCFGEYKENNIRCARCQDKIRCALEKMLNEKEEKEKNENGKSK